LAEHGGHSFFVSSSCALYLTWRLGVILNMMRFGCRWAASRLKARWLMEVGRLLAKLKRWNLPLRASQRASALQPEAQVASRAQCGGWTQPSAGPSFPGWPNDSAELHTELAR
jgi:hypothetical protein